MSLEVNIVGMRCGVANGGTACSYCYETPLGQVNAPIRELDMPAIERALARYPQEKSFSLFGGEPLLAPIAMLEQVWDLGLKRYGKNGVQTGGRPITDEHFALFHKYKVAVSFSIDGPEELNAARRAGDHAATLAATAHSIAAMERCLREKINTGLIVTLCTHNATADRLPRLIEWLRQLDELGLQSVGLHVLEHDAGAAAIALTHDQNFEALVALRTAELGFKTLRFGLFSDMLRLLRGQDEWKWNDGTPAGVSCIWTGCDPFTTPAVKGVNADGSRSLCPRVHKGRIAWGEAPAGPLVRVLALAATPQEEDGCKGCPQLITCKGSCPGTAVGGDWRRRSRDCALWKRLFEYFENALLQVGEIPVTRRKDRVEIERRMAAYWAAGRAVSIFYVLEEMRAGRAPGSAAGYYHQDVTRHDDHHDVDAIFSGISGELAAKGER